MFGLTFSAT